MEHGRAKLLEEKGTGPLARRVWVVGAQQARETWGEEAAEHCSVPRTDLTGYMKGL